MEIKVETAEEMCALMCDNQIPRKRKASMYDPYREDIVKWCAAGVPVSKMLKQMGEGYTLQGLYQFIRTNHLRKQPWTDVYEARNQCEGCEYCHIYENTNGADGRICAKHWKVIGKNVRHSPLWCENEKTDRKGN